MPASRSDKSYSHCSNIDTHVPLALPSLSLVFKDYTS